MINYCKNVSHYQQTSSASRITVAISIKYYEYSSARHITVVISMGRVNVQFGLGFLSVFRVERNDEFQYSLDVALKF